MGSYIKFLKASLIAKEREYKEERDRFINEKEGILREMEELKDKLDSEAKDKEKLQEIIDSFKKTSVPALTFGTKAYSEAIQSGISSSLGTLGTQMSAINIASSLSGITSALGGLGIPINKTCGYCGHTYKPNIGALDINRCPNCNLLN